MFIALLVLNQNSSGSKPDSSRSALELHDALCRAHVLDTRRRRGGDAGSDNVTHRHDIAELPSIIYDRVATR